jgi:glycosyltransferase involved in cell wall biosynthesis
MDISIVIPLLNEEKNVPVLYEELVAVLEPLQAEFELVFVDDGSTDGTFDALHRLNEQDRRVRVIQFRRNFGKAAALMAGFDLAQGQIILTMDGDLQDNPIEIPKFLDRLNDGYDLVSGWKQHRLDPVSKVFPSRVWNLLLRVTTGVPLHDFNCGFKAYRREVVADMQLYGELYRYIPVFGHQKGYRVTEMPVAHRPRLHGQSKFGFKRFGRGFFDLLTILFLGNYGWRPLHLFGSMGAGIFGAGLLIALYLTALWFVDQGPIGTRPLLSLSVLLMIVGVQFLSIGLLAEMFALMNARNSETYSVKARLE